MDRVRPGILLVEDDPVTRELLQVLLESDGYTVESAGDGAAGLACIEAGRVDLVLLDLRLPDMNGTELCRRVRAQEVAAALPIVVVTAAVDDSSVQASLAAGADDYVTKPVDIKELLRRIEIHLATRGSPGRCPPL